MLAVRGDGEMPRNDYELLAEIHRLTARVPEIKSELWWLDFLTHLTTMLVGGAIGWAITYAICH